VARRRSDTRRQAFRGGFTVVTVLGVLGAWAWVAAPGRGAVTPGPPQPLRASLVSASTSGDVLSLVLACHGGSSSSSIDTCAGRINLTSDVTTRGSSTLAVAARNTRPKVVTVETVCSGPYAVRSGLRETVAVTLNATGEALLSQFYRLPSTLAVSGTLALTRRVVFRYPRIVSPISFTWAFNPRFTVAQELAISRVPAVAMVEVVCLGGGCPFAMRSFPPVGHRVALTPAFRGSHLRPHTTLELEITATNHVGKVAVFTIQSGQQPTLRENCLPPGAKGPTRCA
jgi:hypothetical protein